MYNSEAVMRVQNLAEAYSRYGAHKDFVSLAAWQRCQELKVFFYKEVLPLLPPEEKYNMNVQIRKAATSTTQNIAEGYGRYHLKEGIQFYRISRGSVYELKDLLISCQDFGFISPELYNQGIDLLEKAKVTLNGYIKYVQNQLKNSP